MLTLLCCFCSDKVILFLFVSSSAHFCDCPLLVQIEKLGAGLASNVQVNVTEVPACTRLLVAGNSERVKGGETSENID